MGHQPIAKMRKCVRRTFVRLEVPPPRGLPKPRCALVCEKSPHCQPQPPATDCCSCNKEAPKAEAPAKCCGCNKDKEASAASGPAGSAVGCSAYNLQCLSKCKAEKDVTACEANCNKLMDLCNKAK